MDSLTQSEITNPARAVSVALTTLLDLMDGDPAPDFAFLRERMHWFLSSKSGRITGSVYAHDIRGNGLELLESWRGKLGGAIEPTNEAYSDGLVYYALTTEIDRVPVILKAPVQQPDVEQQLRDRIAELGAVASSATEFRLTPAPPAYTPLIVRRNPAYDGTTWAIIHDPGDRTVRRAWTRGGWEMTAVLAHDELYCWPDAETALAQAKQAQDGDPCRPCGCPKRFDRHADGCPALFTEGGEAR